MNYKESNLFAPENLKYVKVNNFPQNYFQEKNIRNGIQNACNILNSLERSLQKTRKYEAKLVKCKASHPHSHNDSEWWESDVSEEKGSKWSKTATTKSWRSQVDLAESWSTMSIVCLQYQYEELSKRYESLLQAYDERCNTLNLRDDALTRLKQHARKTHAQLAQAHKALLAVGDKYLALRRKRNIQISLYKDKIKHLQSTVLGAVEAAKQARLALDNHLAKDMAAEQDPETALLLAEIRKCNMLLLENLRLKVQIEELSPGYINWET